MEHFPEVIQLKLFSQYGRRLLRFSEAIECVNGHLFQSNSTHENQRVRQALECFYNELCQTFRVSSRIFHIACDSKKHLQGDIYTEEGFLIGPSHYPPEPSLHDPDFYDFYIRSERIFLGDRNLACPCPHEKTHPKSTVEIRVRHSTDSPYPAEKYRVNLFLADIAYAIHCSEDHKPRSGIREALLASALRLLADQYLSRTSGETENLLKPLTDIDFDVSNSFIPGKSIRTGHRGSRSREFHNDSLKV